MKKLVNVIEEATKWIVMGAFSLYGLGVFIMTITNDRATGLVDLACDILNQPVINIVTKSCMLVYCIIKIAQLIAKIIKKHRNK